VAFLEQDKQMPVLIPLGLDTTGQTYFNNLCKNLSVSLKDVTGFVPTDRYILNLESTIQYDPRLTIYNVGSFNSLTYRSWDLSNRIDRIQLVTNITNRLNLENELQYKSIITDTKEDIKFAMQDDSFVVFDKVVATVSFDSEAFPYITQGDKKGVNELRMQLVRLASGSENDFSK